MSFGIELDPSPGEVIYFEISGRHYALACAPENAVLLPSGDSGRSAGGGRYHTRQLADSPNDLPAGYRIEPKGELFFVYFQGRQIGWAGDLAGAQGLVEHDLGERSSRHRFVNRSAR